MRVLITGITGYISQYLLKTIPNDLIVGGTYHFTLSAQEKVNFKDITLVSLNLAERIDKQLNLDQIDVVIHTAAVSSLAVCEQSPDFAQRVNCYAAAELAELCAKHSCHLIYLSTDIVFDGKNAPYYEDDLPQPVNNYGSSKYAGEQKIAHSGCTYTIARLALVLGKGLGRKKNFMDWLHDKVVAGEEIPLFTDEIRTPVFAADAARMIWQIAQEKKQGIFHLCGKEVWNRYSLGSKLVAEMNNNFSNIKKVLLAEVPYERPGDVSLINTKLDFITQPVLDQLVHQLSS